MKYKLSQVIISITNLCNLQCLHCYNGENQNKHTMQIADFKHVLKNIQWVETLVLSGGEPLILGEKITNYIIIARNYCNKLILTTNGTLLDDELIEILKKYKVDILQISIDGLLKNHEIIRGKKSFEKTILSISKGLKKGLNITIMMVANASNYIEILDVYNMLKKLGIQSFSIDRFLPAGRAKQNNWLQLDSQMLKKIHDQLLVIESEGEMLIHTNDPIYLVRKMEENKIPKEIIEQVGKLKHVGCSAGRSVLLIDSFCNVYPCSGIDMPIINALEKPFSEFWNNDFVINLQNRYSTGKCSQCLYKEICGGCRACSEKYFSDDSLCYIFVPAKPFGETNIS